MAVCRVCGARADMVSTRKLHLFPTDERYFCERHYAASVRSRDTSLGLFVLFSIAALVGAIFFKLEVERTEAENRLELHNRTIAERDFDRDGYLDVWETQAGPHQIDAFHKVGYPWATVAGEAASDKTPFITIPVQQWQSLIENNVDVRVAVNFPQAMRGFVERLTDLQSATQIERVFLTTHRDLAMIVRTYEKPPAEWPPAAKPTPRASKKKGEPDAETQAPAPPVKTVATWLCFEPLTLKEGLLITQVLGLKPETLPFAYQDVAPEER